MSEVRCETVGIGAEAIDYLAAWDLQREVHAGVVAGERPDTVLLLEPPPTFTAGKRTDAHERPVDTGGAPVIDVDRGGKITFHGPGQLVGYPIVRLPDHVLVVDFVRRMEEAMIATCAAFGVETARVPGRSGVWLKADPADPIGRPERKIGAIGIRVSRGVTMHGIALNCDVDLAWYEEPLPAEDLDGHVRLSQSTSLPIAVGESLYHPSHFREYLQRGACSIIQADVGRIGGITPWLKCAHLAETFNVSICPHFLMELHVGLCAAVPNAAWVEYIPQLDELTSAGMTMRDGRAVPSDAPGLGIAWDWERIDRQRIDGATRLIR